MDELLGFSHTDARMEDMDKQADSQHESHPSAGEVLSFLAAQLAASVLDNNLAMSNLVAAHGNIAAKLGQSGEIDASIAEELGKMVVAFQEHDSLNQRLEHVIQALHETCSLLKDKDASANPYNWETLEAQIISHYTTDQERQVHSGQKPVSPAVASNDIELF